MIIFRAGLTGCIAALAIPDSVIIDKGGELRHKAVLRFRSDAVSKITGIPFKKIKVTKSVFDGERFVEWNPSLANMYSLKVINGVYDRSIDNLETVERWVAPEDFHDQMIDLLGERIIHAERYTDWGLGKPIISTQSLPDLLQMLGESEMVNLRMDFNPITVTTLDIHTPCDVHQTVYFPERDCSVYRVTLEGQKMIIECTEETPLEDIEWVPAIFGLHQGQWNISTFNYSQKIGKIAPVDDSIRKELIHYLTEKYNIYSLGRTAIWKNILLDDVVQDIARIQAMISKSKYDRMLGK